MAATQDPIQTVRIPRDHRRRRARFGNVAVIIGTVLTMIGLTIAQEPIGWSWVACVALAPWAVMVATANKPVAASIISYVLGVAYYLLNLHWLGHVTTPGYIALCIYLGVYFPLTGWVLRRVYLHKRWPFTFVLPAAWVGQEILRAWVFTGFPWLFLGHVFHDTLSLIQICDMIGVYGVTFLAGMVNGLICDALLRPIGFNTAGRKRLVGPFVLGFATAVAWLGCSEYGRFRLDESEKTMQPGPTVSVIQGVVPQYVRGPDEDQEAIFADYYALSLEALKQTPKPDLIVWPETMVASPLNQEFLQLQNGRYRLDEFPPYVRAHRFNSQLEQLAQQDVALLIGAHTIMMEDMGNELRPVHNSNSAFLYLPGGGRFESRYDKMHLVPFGEAVPFKQSWPWLYQQLNKLTPYDFEYTLDAGAEPTVFSTPIASTTEPARFAVAICYEDVIPRVVRRLAVADGQKHIDFLLNISNDGWFVRKSPKDDSVYATSELYQHWVICKFRAIENRIGIARAVNTGISGMILPSGAAQTRPLAHTLPAEPSDRQAVSGFITDQVYTDSRVSLYSKAGDWFAWSCLLVTVAVFFIARSRRLCT